jgi:hypothetical protein
VDRWNRRGRLAAGTVCGAALGVCFLGFAGVAAASGGYTITYSPIGSIEAVCTSHPDVTSLTIEPGTPVFLVNRTGVTAIADTGRRRSDRIEDGEAVTVRLTRGEHAVRMVPDCLISGQIATATIYVVRDAPTVGPGPSWTDPPPPAPTTAPTGDQREGAGGSSDAGGRSSTMEPSPSGGPGAGGGAGVTRPPAGGPAGTGPDALGAGTAAASDAAPILNGAADDDEISAAFRVADVDHRGKGLVAVVALICILGVSVGIIRAIRAQRTSRAVRRVT